MYSPPPSTTSQQNSTALVDIIIPIYNVQDYIEECLESLITQTFFDINIICINDGSTDSSREHVLNYIKKDKRIRLIDQENQGVSIARNKGIEVSSAPYIMFCDPDDFYTIDAVEKLYTAIEESHADIAIGQIYHYPKKRGKFYVKKRQSTPNVEGIHSITPRDFALNDWSQCGKLLRRSHIEKYHLRFPEKIQYGEDLAFIFSYLFVSSTIHYIQAPLYYYRLHNTSATGKTRTQEKHSPSANDPLKVISLLFQFMIEHNVIKQYIMPLIGLYIECLRFALNKLPQNNIDSLYESAQQFLALYLPYIQEAELHQELYEEIQAIQAGRIIHKLFLENNALKTEVKILKYKQLKYKLRYFKYAFLARFPIYKQNIYKEKYTKLQNTLRRGINFRAFL